MEKHPDVARGMPNFGNSKARVDNVWEATSKLLNAIGPPIRTPAKWRKVWTDYRGRLKKKLSINKSSIRQTGGGPSEYCELTPTELAVDSIVNTSIAANPSGPVYGLSISNTSNKSPKHVQTSSPTQLSTGNSQQPQISSLLLNEDMCITEENDLEAGGTLIKPQFRSGNQYSNKKKRRRIEKNEERKKLIKLAEDQTAEIARNVLALEKLTAAIENQTKILQEKFK